jgi:predicted GH43/DUF377 family glycosyl hydrolase
VTTDVFPYSLTRLRTIMEPEPGNALEAEGVLNPASGRGPDGELYLLPRMVAQGNVSRVGLAKVVVENGEPVGVERQGVVLEPANRWEQGAMSAGTEDPRTTWVPSLGLHLMTYVAYGPMGPRTALAVSADLREWRRLGPVLFSHDPALDIDLNLYSNKDTVFFPEVVPDPDGVPSYALLHRPTWDLELIRTGAGQWPPASSRDERPAIWISYVAADAVRADISALAVQHKARELANPVYDYESLKIGAGPAPIRVPEGWLLIHHGVTGVITNPWSIHNDVRYTAGAMILDAQDPSRVLSRTEQPLLEPETEHERVGTVGNVVFPTAIEEVDGQLFVFYGMADAKIGVARLDRTEA